MKRIIKLPPKTLIAITATIAVIMVASALYELNQNKREVFQLISEESHALIETIYRSSINTLNSSENIENLIVERLFNNAHYIALLDSLNLLNDAKLRELSKKNNLFRVNIFDKKGNRIFTSRVAEKEHPHEEGQVNRFDELEPILTNEVNEMIIGLRESRVGDEQRYAIAIARPFNRGAIVINLNAKDLLEFRKKIGIGRIIQDIADIPSIKFIVLQDTVGILVASPGVDSLDSIVGDEFLQNALNSDSVNSRVTLFKDEEIYEVVKRLIFDDDIIGIFRIGISLDKIEAIKSRMIRRLIIISAVLSFIAIILISIIFTNQNLKSITDEFKKFKTFTGSILENMGEAVIVFDKEFKITLVNHSGEKLLNTKSTELIGKNLLEIMNSKFNFLNKIINTKSIVIDFEKEIEIGGNKLILSNNLTKNFNESNEIESYTLVIKDITEERKLEEQASRTEKLRAMGELASGVAHEIRNPINAIGMIAQRLQSEFIPNTDKADYLNLTEILKAEVARINKIITQFLSYSKPLQLELKTIDVKSFFENLYQIFLEQAKSKKIEFTLINKQPLEFKFDPELMKQAMMNLIQNAFDAVDLNGKVEIGYYIEGNSLMIFVKDNGKGIQKDNLKKIFDLYFTTKKDGNGLGLSICQKIIDQHQGTIDVESEVGKGTTFKIYLTKI